MNEPRRRPPARLTTQQMIDLYEQTGSLRKVAEQAGVNHATVARRLESAGHPRHPRGRRLSSTRPVNKGRRKNCFTEWVKAHPGASLPSSLQELCDLTGCSRGAVSSHMKREKSRMQEAIQRGLVRITQREVIDTRGRRVRIDKPGTVVRSINANPYRSCYRVALYVPFLPGEPRWRTSIILVEVDAAAALRRLGEAEA